MSQYYSRDLIDRLPQARSITIIGVLGQKFRRHLRTFCAVGLVESGIFRKIRLFAVVFALFPCVALRHGYSSIRIPQLIAPSAFRDLVSGRRRGLVARGLRALLRLAEVPTTWVVRARNLRYDRGTNRIHQAGVPVVCVGNLTLGGTGKTPLVEWISRWAEQRRVRVAIVSRGYGSQAGSPNDEALELAHALPGVPHVQHANRVAAACEAVERHGAQLIVLDDGFQHRRLGRELDVVLLDATEPFGFEHLFPRGTLREPIGSLRRASVVVLSRADMLDETAREAIRRRVAQHAPEAAWCEVEHRPTKLVNHAGKCLPLEQLTGHKIAAFCGIGNPAGFRHTLSSLGCRPIAWREFADHHSYGPQDIESLRDWSVAAGADMAVCTRKDLVKLQVEQIGNAPLWAVDIELRFLQGQDALEAKLNAVV